MASEEPRPRYRRHAPLMKVRDLTVSTPNPVRIICIVVESTEGAALVQDIMDEPGKQGSITVDVDGQLAVAEKYMLIGDVRVVSGPHGKEMRLAVSASYNIKTLDIMAYKEALALEERINQTFIQ